jgi:hypothetical protein
MKVHVKQFMVGALLALTIGAAGAATAASKGKQPPPLDPCAIEYLRCLSSGKFSSAICAMQEQTCRSTGLGRIGANTESPAPTLQDLSPDADFHAEQFQSLLASVDPNATSIRVTPEQCRRFDYECTVRRIQSKCVQYLKYCVD